ncbi:MAG: 4-hydroxy-tetrahydrodipicolinate synthase, partial [Proteobacteria bacterium]|nr:4-hydroxy-tetrahydrodipicolinate synthase [Pseudomonadota bacterium]
MFTGSYVALVTPMTEARALDWGALDALVDWHLEAGTHGFVPVGTTGESPTLDIPDHLKVIERVIQRVAGRRPVLAGTGSNATDEAILMTREAHAMGASGSLQVTPYYNKPTQEGLYQHFSAIADAVPLPMVLYNVPGRTVVDLLPETVGRLAAHPLIVALKEATGSAERIVELKAQVPGDFALLSGEDGMNVALMEAGCVGVISVTANVVPAALAKICEAALAGDFATARALDAPLTALHEAL